MSEIKAFKHLKDYSYYNDLYDKFTVEECRRIEKRLSKLEYKPKTEGGKKSKKKEVKVTIDLSPTPLYFIKGERYLEKAGTIREWMKRDETQDEKLENTPPPQNVLCPSCGSEMIIRTKYLQNDYRDKKEKVLFFFNCPKCDKRKLIFEDGKNWECPPTLCKKCNSEMDEINRKSGRKIITTYKCPKCNYKEEDILDLDEKPEPEKPDPDFEKDRKRFCLSPEEGRNYISQKERFNHFFEALKDLSKKAEINKKIAKIKKLNIAQLKKFLSPPLEKEKYIKLDFAKPEMDRGIIINFTVQDNKTDREEYDSRIQLQRILKQTLEKTNWRLMSEGVYYRLGILSGRLRGYELEEDLLKLVKT